MESKLAELLLDPAAVPAKVREHVEQCERCRGELAELQATMALLDTWESPEPSPYFLTRLDARMREERQAAPEGWFARLRDRFAYGPPMHVRPLAAMALAVMLLVGGGTYLGVTDLDQTTASARTRPPWFTICRCWITTPSCWTRWKPCPPLPQPTTATEPETVAASRVRAGL